MIYEPNDPSLTLPESNQRAVDDIVGKGPGGAIALAGVAVLLVLAIWFAFYFFVFIPRS